MESDVYREMSALSSGTHSLLKHAGEKRWREKIYTILG